MPVFKQPITKFNSIPAIDVVGHFTYWTSLSVTCHRLAAAAHGWYLCRPMLSRRKAKNIIYKSKI